MAYHGISWLFRSGLRMVDLDFRPSRGPFSTTRKLPSWATGDVDLEHHWWMCRHCAIFPQFYWPFLVLKCVSCPIKSFLGPNKVTYQLRALSYPFFIHLHLECQSTLKFKARFPPESGDSPSNTVMVKWSIITFMFWLFGGWSGQSCAREFATAAQKLNLLDLRLEKRTRHVELLVCCQSYWGYVSRWCWIHPNVVLWNPNVLYSWYIQRITCWIDTPYISCICMAIP